MFVDVSCVLKIVVPLRELSGSMPCFVTVRQTRLILLPTITSQGSYPSAAAESSIPSSRQCRVCSYASGKEQWRSMSCDAALSYVCKKTPNDTRRAEPLGRRGL